MARILEISLNRIFRSRMGVALVLFAIVLAVVGIARLFSDGRADSRSSFSTESPGPVVSIDPGDNDSILDSAPPPAPSTSPGQTQPALVANAFATAWIDHKGVSPKAWHDKLLQHATTKLAKELGGVDPAGVPADRILGPPNLVPIGATVVTAEIPMESGKLSLQLVAPDGKWLVDTIDWTPA